MRKTLVVLVCVFIIAGIALAVGWPYVGMEFANSAYYAEQDKRAYEHYTPELLKNTQNIGRL